MHNPYCACKACQTARQFDWAESEFVGFGEVDGESVHASPFSEVEELELAAELLSISSEEELDLFLGKLIKGAWKGIKKVGRFVGKIAKPLGGVLKGVAKAALPFVGGALGSFIPIPGVGTALGSALGGALSKALELEYGELDQEDQELEMARRFVRIAGTAARQAALTNPNADPHTTAQAAVAAAARQHVANLQARVVDDDLTRTRATGSLPSGRWVRQGSSIRVLGVYPRNLDGNLNGETFQYENPTRFSYDDVHPMVVALLDANQVERALLEAVRHGDSNVNHLADLVFFKLYPDRQGRFISRNEPDYSALSRTWLQINNTLVQDALNQARNSPARSRPPCYQEAAVSTGISRVWTFYSVPTDPRNFYKFVINVGNFGVTDIALEINDKNAQNFDLSAAKIRALQSMAPEFCHAGIDLHLMCWIRPDATYLQQAAQALRPLCQALPVRSLLFDVEEPWTKNTNEAGATALLSRAWPFGAWPCLLGATSTTYLPSSVRPVAKLCDYVLPQAYSTNVLGQMAGEAQQLAHTQWKGLGKRIVMGLAAYDLNLNRPQEKGSAIPIGRRMTEQEALQRAIVAAERSGAREVAYWSLDHLVKKGAEARAAFVRQAAGKARAGRSQASSL